MEYEMVMSFENKDQVTKIIAFDENRNILISEALELTIISEQKQKITRKINRNKVVIGTAESNDLVIESDEYMSRKHCKLQFDGEQLFLTDLGSTNGTIYKGEKIDRILMSDGGRFTAGKTEIRVKRVEEKELLRPISGRQMGQMIGASRAMKEIFALIKRVAPADVTVCITGESGTGKELVARSIHDLSPRSKGPFVAINCGAIPPNIIESELFGHEKGAFTGASGMHRGVFEQASGGTLFLDEIGEMPPELQTRLLRALETRSIKRVGGHTDIPVDVRVVAATNQNLKENVSKGRFREDLFFRLYIIPIHIPPLRERREDIKVLVAHFTKTFAAGEDAVPVSEEAMRTLIAHNWAGNVRELKNTIQRAMILGNGCPISAASVELTELGPKREIGSMPLISQEKEALIEALRKSRGNQCKAAGILKIARTTLANKLKRYDIDIGEIVDK